MMNFGCRLRLRPVRFVLYDRWRLLTARRAGEVVFLQETGLWRWRTSTCWFCGHSSPPLCADALFEASSDAYLSSCVPCRAGGRTRGRRTLISSNTRRPWTWDALDSLSLWTTINKILGIVKWCSLLDGRRNTKLEPSITNSCSSLQVF